MRVLITDDEPLVRLGIKTMLQRQMGTNIDLYEAVNGAQAIDVLEKEEIDVLFTDVKMPVMDGIELTKRTRQLFPKVKILILSNYNDFEFVREALKVGASDYLLKYDVDGNKLEKIIHETFETANLDLELPIKISEKDVLIKESILRDLLLFGNTKTYEKYKSNIRFNLDPDKYKVTIYMCINQYESVLMDHYNRDKEAFTLSVKNLFMESMRKISAVEIIEDVPGHYIAATNNLDRNTLKEAMLRLIEIFEKFMDIHISFGISEVFEGIGSLSHAVSEAKNACSLCYFMRKGTDINIRFASGENKVFPDDQLIKQTIQDFEKIICERDYAAVNNFCETIFKELFAKGNHVQKTKILITKIMERISDAYSQYGDKDFEDTVFDNFYDSINTGEILEQSRTLVKKAIEILVMQNNKGLLSIGQYDNIINKAIEYINMNYCCKDLTLTSVSRYLSINPSYFSRLFKEKTGKNFIEYVAKLRVEKAKQLISRKDFLIKDACYQTGYENYNHFCKTFKKYTGKSPSEFL